ncbi:MAG: VTT domain-containing protein [Pyrinomonadaceae bacterium]
MSDLFQIIAQILNSDFTRIGEFSPVLVFFIFFFGTFVSEDAACLAAGALAGQGRISFALGVSACIAGIFVGDILLYWIGRIFGWRVVETGFFRRFVSKRSISKSSAWLEKRGATAVFLSRFLPGLRLPTYLAAGFLRTDFWKFFLYFLIAALVWTPILVGSAAYASGTFLSGGLIVEVVALFVVVRLIFHFASWKNRRMFVGRIKRILNWEFWPIRVFYFPVVLYVLFLSFKHRSLTVFTCANPGIPSGGFIGESKNDIYIGLGTNSESLPYLLKHTLLHAELSAEQNLVTAKQFIKENSVSYPVVLKPDAGERGKGVKIVQNEIELGVHIREIEIDFVLQEYFDGEEASIFYYRYPEQTKGEIFSITEKEFPVLCGDGRSDLEQLILRDRRAVCLAKSYFSQNSSRLDIVPDKDEQVQIINIGTHSMGAIFLDGGWLQTELLLEKIDSIARGVKGFYFGRFDIRTRSFDDLKNGENFRVVELNGVTSESTNIYDPKFSLIDAYRILFRQWAIAFEIGIQNRKLGATPTSVRTLVSLIFKRPPIINEPATDDTPLLNL